MADVIVRDINYKLQKLEIIGEKKNDKLFFSITDCDKSFCSICKDNGCSFDYFFKNNKEKALLFVNEVYNYETKKNPS